jgi:predicted  nucleic acid-binding Zn-ribbon protein
MRSVERLIRQLTNARISVVHDEQRKALKQVRGEHALTEAPAPVRAAVLRLRKLAVEKRQLEKTVEAAGYRSYHIEGNLTRSTADAEKRAIDGKAEARIRRIESLRSEALIDTIGTTAEESKAALMAFRAAILKA